MTSLFALPDHISTPVKPSATRLTAGSDNLDAGRISLNDSIGAAVLALPTDDFFEHVLPPLSPVLQQFLPKIIARLQAPGIRIYDSRKPGWVAFLNKRPKSNENTHFKALVSIASGVEAAVAHVFFNSGYAKPHQLMKFSNAPNAVPKSDWRRAAHRPDGYFHLCKRQLPDCHWMDIGPTGEYKLGDSEAKVRDVSPIPFSEPSCSSPYRTPAKFSGICTIPCATIHRGALPMRSPSRMRACDSGLRTEPKS